MATISEDYVSFETAKQLKEKGFDEPVVMKECTLFETPRFDCSDYDERCSICQYYI